MGKDLVMADPIYFEVIEGIGHIVLNDPPENRMTMHFFRVLNQIVKNVSCLKDISGLIICSSGRHFSSGADLDDLINEINKPIVESEDKECREQYPSILEENVQTFKMLSIQEIPVIAAIQGVCIGSALELALCADLRICEARASLGLPEALFNLMPGCGGSVRLPHLTGVETAIQMIFTGDLISAGDALEKGIADIVVPRKQAVIVARKLIKRIQSECVLKGQLREFTRKLNAVDLIDSITL